MHVETVRVVNPANPSSYMTINEADLAGHHKLWLEQAPDYQARTLRLDPAERDLAAMLTTRVLADQADMSLDDYMALPIEGRVARLREAADAFEKARETARERRQAAFDEVERPIYQANAEAALSVRKGPRGLWFVMRDEERVGRGHETEADARAELASLSNA